VEVLACLDDVISEPAFKLAVAVLVFARIETSGISPKPAAMNTQSGLETESCHG
jgi:hypothetical protein